MFTDFATVNSWNDRALILAIPLTSSGRNGDFCRVSLGHAYFSIKS